MAVSSSSKYWLSSTMGYQLCSYHCWWSPILSMGVLHFNKSCPAIFMNNNFLKGCGHSEHVSPKDFLCHNSYCKFHIEMFPVCRRFIKIQLNCIRALARHLAALLLVKILTCQRNYKPKKYKWVGIAGEQRKGSKPHCSLPGFLIE